MIKDILNAREEAIIAEFGLTKGIEIIEQNNLIKQHCHNRGIKFHSINDDGSCNQGCC